MKKFAVFIGAAMLCAACQIQTNKPQDVADASKPAVYFTKDISPEGLVKIYDQISQNID